MKYIQGNIGITLILSIDKFINIKWYSDAAFVVHKYMRIQYGGFTTMGKVVAYV